MVYNNYKIYKNYKKVFLAIFVLGVLSALGWQFLHSRPLAAWWTNQENGSSWAKRKQLTLTNNSGAALNSTAVVAVTVDTKALYGLNQVRPDCSDIRIVYQPNSSTYTELTRHVVYASGGSCATSAATKVHFALQAGIANGSSDANYYLYYGNSHANLPSSTQTAFSVGAKTATFVCPFDGSTTCVAAGTATPSTETGAIRYSGGKSALSFDGNSDYVSAGNVGTGVKTVEFWVYPNSTTNYFIDLNGSAYIQASAGTISATGFTGATIYVNGTATSTIAANAWSHVAVVATTAVNASAVNIGKISTNYLNGKIDELHLSSIERYSTAFTPQTSPFVRDQYTKLLLHFDENGADPRNATVAIDDSGNANHGTITGAKYVGGLVGVDGTTSADATGYQSSQSYGGHSGIFVEEGTTNKITNPSFENSTSYDTNWTGAAAQTLTLQPDATDGKDNSMRAHTAAEQTYNYGAATILYITQYSSAIIEFDLSSIPTTAICTGAVLTMTTGNTWTPGATCTVRSIAVGNAEWIEGTKNGTLAGAGEPCYDALAANGSGGVTTAWAGSEGCNTSGVDYEAAVLGSLVVPSGTAAGVAIATNLTVARVQGWFGVANTNYGIKLWMPLTDMDARWISSDHATEAYRPKLVVNYTIPYTTAVVNTTAPYYKFGSSSVKIVATTNTTYTTSIAVGNTASHTLSAYVYDGTSGNVGGIVSATVAKVIFNGVAYAASSYVDQGGGWWRLTYSGTPASTAANYGVEVQSGKTIYLDGVQLEEKAYATTYADGSLGTGYAWDTPASPHASSSTRAISNLQFPISNNISAAAGSFSVWLKTPWAGNDSVAHTIFDVDTSAGTLKLQKNSSNNLVLTDGTNSATKAVSWTADQWQYITATWAAGALNIYVNSAVGTPAAAYSAPTLSTSLYLGQDKTNANLTNSTLSDIRVYSSALSSAEISDLYYAGLLAHSEAMVVDQFSGTKGQDPIAIWHFNEGYGSTANDSSIYRNNLSLGTGSSAPTFSENPSGNTQRQSVLKFDGSNDYLYRAFDSDFDLSTNPFSVSGWFRHPSTISGTDTILARQSGSVGYKVYMNSSGYLCYSVNADSVCTTVSYADSKWHNFEAVRDSTTLTLYIDGLQKAQTTGITPATVNGNNILYVGIDSDGASNPWDGFLDELIIYPYARSSVQAKSDYEGVSTAYSMGIDPNDPLNQGLVGYWKMDEASWNGTANEVIDSSGNANHGVGVGTTKPTTGAGKFGNGGSFDGSGNYINLGSPTSLIISNNVTWSYWVKFNSVSGVQLLMSWGSNYFSGTNGNKLVFGRRNIAYDVTGLTSLVTNTWYHVTTTINSSGNVSIYLNGNLDKSGSTTITTPAGGLFFSLSSFPVNGTIDETRIYNRSLSPAEVRQLYDWAPGPVAQWNFEEGSGGTVYDTSGNGNTGTFGTGSAAPSWATGKVGKALRFDGGDYISLGNPSTLNITRNITVSAWAKFSTSQDNKMFISRWGTDQSYILGVLGNKVLFCIRVSEVNKCATSSQTYNDGTWHYFIGIFDGSYVRLYVDGSKEIIQGDATSGPIDSPAQNVSIGAYNDTSGGLSGLLDEVKIYNYARTQKQIIEDMLGSAEAVTGGGGIGSTTKPAAAIGYWKFDEGYGTTANNSGSAGSPLNGNLGTGSSAPTWSNDGKFGKALSFDGSNDYAGVGSTAGNTQTVSFWVNPLTNSQYFIDLDAGSHYISASGGTISATGFSLPTIYVNGKVSTALTANVWQHIVVTTATSFGATNIKFGKVSTNYLNGKIDEVKIYNYALTQDEVKLDYNRGSSLVLGSTSTNPWWLAGGVNPSSVVAAYQPIGAGNSAAAYINLANPGTYNATPGVAPTWNNATGWTFAGAQYLDTTIVPPSQSPPSWSVIVRYSDASASSWAMPFGIEGAGYSYMNVVPYYTPGVVRYGTGTSSPLVTPNLPAGILAIAGRSHYRNGVIDGPDGTGNYSATAFSITMGANRAVAGNINFWFNGKVQAVAFYNTTLSATQVASISNAMAALSGNGTSSSYSPGSSNSSSSSYCIPGDTATCTAPVAEWSFEEGQGTSAYDTSGHNKTGTLTGSYKRISGKYGKGAWSGGNANQDYLSYSNPGLNGAYTIEYWVKPDNTSYTYAWNAQHVQYNWFHYGLRSVQFTCTSHTLYHEYEGSEYSANWSHPTICTKKWQHWALTYNGSDTATLFLNGISRGNKTINPPVWQTSGGTNRAFDYASTQNSGSYDQYRIYNYARTPAQIAWDYNRGRPVGEWKMDECSGTSIKDSSGNGNTGTLTGGTAGNCSDGTGTTAWNLGAAGKYNSSLNFDGTNYVSVGTGVSANSISLWVKPTSNTASIMQFNASSYLSASSGVISATGISSPTYYIDGRVTSSPTLTAGTWNHIVVTSASAITGTAIKFGLVGTTYFSGQIDEVQIYNYPLTAIQVKTLYNDGAVHFGPVTGSP